MARLGSETSSISLLESVDLFAEGDGFSKIGASDFFQDGVSGFSEHCETVRLRYGALSLCFSEANRVAQEALAHVVFGP